MIIEKNQKRNFKIRNLKKNEVKNIQSQKIYKFHLSAFNQAKGKFFPQWDWKLEYLDINHFGGSEF